jgi:surfeit locus 1 family protein
MPRAAGAPSGDAGSDATPSAAAAASTNASPVGGLTVVTFRNAHLSYAITWYGLALLVVGATWIVIREERRHA